MEDESGYARYSYDAMGNASENCRTFAHTKDVIDNKGIPGANTIAVFSTGLIKEQTKKITTSSNKQESSTQHSPLILKPKEDVKKEQSIYQQIIYSR